MRETEALTLFKPRGLDPSRVDSAIHLCKADKLEVCSRKSEKKKKALYYEKGLLVNNAHKNVLFSASTSNDGGEILLEKMHAFKMSILTSLTKLK